MEFQNTDYWEVSIHTQYICWLIYRGKKQNVFTIVRP